MKKNNFIYFLLFGLMAICAWPSFAVNNADSPWVAESGLKNTMPVYAQIYKENALFEPKGVLLGVFKENKCYGFTSLINGPTGNLFQLTMMCNNDTEDGFHYKVYDPNTKTVYTVGENLSFTNGVAVGKIFAPAQLHITGVFSALQSTAFNPIAFAVYPNPIDDVIQIRFNTPNAGNTETVVELYSLTGEKIATLFAKSIPSNGVVSVNRKKEWKKGLYILKSVAGQHTFATKIRLN